MFRQLFVAAVMFLAVVAIYGDQMLAAAEKDGAGRLGHGNGGHEHGGRGSLCDAPKEVFVTNIDRSEHSKFFFIEKLIILCNSSYVPSVLEESVSCVTKNLVEEN